MNVLGKGGKERPFLAREGTDGVYQVSRVVCGGRRGKDTSFLEEEKRKKEKGGKGMKNGKRPPLLQEKNEMMRESSRGKRGLPLQNRPLTEEEMARKTGSRKKKKGGGSF